MLLACLRFLEKFQLFGMHCLRSLIAREVARACLACLHHNPSIRTQVALMLGGIFPCSWLQAGVRVLLTCLVYGTTLCYSLNLECPPKARVVEGLSFSWCSFRDVVGQLRGGMYQKEVRSFRGSPWKGILGLRISLFLGAVCVFPLPHLPTMMFSGIKSPEQQDSILMGSSHFRCKPEETGLSPKLIFQYLKYSFIKLIF